MSHSVVMAYIRGESLTQRVERTWRVFDQSTAHDDVGSDRRMRTHQGDERILVQIIARQNATIRLRSFAEPLESTSRLFARIA